ncbi:MAG: hypothetical protein WCF10_06745 [Polyangiales bacterium]
MGLGIQTTRLIGVALALLALSCADSGGPVTVDAQWNLSCPTDGVVGCGALAPETCLGSVGQRAIVGEYRQTACTGDPIVASCDAVERPDGTLVVTLDADVGGEFAFKLDRATVDISNGSVVQPSACNVTIIEDGLQYDIGACGGEPPSIAQPCQLSSVSVQGRDISFDLQCNSLLSSVTGLAFDVGAVGGGPTTIRFGNCTGL